ncbi:MAG: PQQ-dependent sugar dehydrogenase, partial [Planctomycetales bacterium]|nr:PQQ-dependent sugar dehydrogenase [Planctomycetales bacterium]
MSLSLKRAARRPTDTAWRFFHVCAVAMACAAASIAQDAQGALAAQQVAELPGGDFGTQMYTGIQYAPGRPNDVFVSRADGKIYRVDLTDGSFSPFIEMPDADFDVGGGYWGLLGFTFAPDFAESGDLYVHVALDRPSANGPGPAVGVHHRTYIRRYSLADPLSDAPTLGQAENLLRWDEPGPDHNGGWLGFQPGDPHTLWITSGDGRNDDQDRDPTRTGQDPTDLRGGILRIDVSGGGAGEFGAYGIPIDNPFADGTGGAPEVWSYGVRSPWGASFDRATGDFLFGDVGAYKDRVAPLLTSGNEEINFERFGSEGGRNYGWRVLEGTFAAPEIGQEPGDPSPDDPSLIAPLYEYDYGGGYGTGDAPQFTGRSVTGGYVYRGPIDELYGKYVFGDWSSRQIWAFEIDRDANALQGGVVPDSLVDLSQSLDRQLTGDFGGPGVTQFGEDQAGNLYFVELDGTLFKIVGDVAGDFDGDFDVDSHDLEIWTAALAASADWADADGDGDSDGHDFLAWQRHFGIGATTLV